MAVVVQLDDALCAIAAGAADAAEPLLAQAAAACGGARRVAIVRCAFLADGARVPPLSAALRPLGHGVVALGCSCVQQPAEALLVDEWELPAAQGLATMVSHSLPLARFLTQRGFRVRLASDVAAAPAAESAAVQSTNSILMVAPTAFASNAEAAVDNAFMAAARDGASGAQAAPAEAHADVRAVVLSEYAGLYRTLAAAGVRVRLFAHAVAHGTPDSCFPNNWFSLCAGKLVLYPMKCANRARERDRPDILAALRAHPGATCGVLDLSAAERDAPPAALEGTGSLVLDHLRRVAYLARSERSDEALARRAAEALGFQVHAFDATDAEGRPVYHTNVVMSVGTGFAVVCADAVADTAQRAQLLAALAAGGREVVLISRAQMGAMCGNVLELRDGDGVPVLALSSQAHDAFESHQRAALLRHLSALLHAPCATLEAVGGGSVRCCIAELFAA